MTTKNTTKTMTTDEMLAKLLEQQEILIEQNEEIMEKLVDMTNSGGGYQLDRLFDE